MLLSQIDTVANILEVETFECKSVQKSVHSQKFASHVAYRNLLRPSSIHESSHPSAKLFLFVQMVSRFFVGVTFESLFSAPASAALI